MTQGKGWIAAFAITGIFNGCGDSYVNYVNDNLDHYDHLVTQTNNLLLKDFATINGEPAKTLAACRSLSLNYDLYKRASTLYAYALNKHLENGAQPNGMTLEDIDEIIQRQRMLSLLNLATRAEVSRHSEKCGRTFERS